MTETTTSSINPDTPAPATAPVAPKRKKARRQVPSGQVHVLASFNNTIITITDPKGAVIVTASAGSSGFRGSKKGTAFAAQVATEKALNNAREAFGLSKVEVIIKGIGLGREAALRSLSNSPIQVENLKDITAVPHGGVRPRKARRV